MNSSKAGAWRAGALGSAVLMTGLLTACSSGASGSSTPGTISIPTPETDAQRACASVESGAEVVEHATPSTSVLYSNDHIVFK